MPIPIAGPARVANTITKIDLAAITLPRSITATTYRLLSHPPEHPLPENGTARCLEYANTPLIPWPMLCLAKVTSSILHTGKFLDRPSE